MISDGIKGGKWGAADQPKKRDVTRSTKAADLHKSEKFEGGEPPHVAAGKQVVAAGRKAADAVTASGKAAVKAGGKAAGAAATAGGKSAGTVTAAAGKVAGAGSGAKPASKPTDMRRKSSGRDFRGEAHKLYMKYASRQDGVLIKRQMLMMMKALVKEGKFMCSSEEKLKAFVDNEFAKNDTNQDAKLQFEEFLEFFSHWLDESARDIVDYHEMQACKVETLFMKYDKNHDFNITEDELRLLVEEMHPAGLPKPKEEELMACVKEIMMHDSNGNGGISFDEFATGYNAMMDRIAALHKTQRSKVMDSSGFRGMIRDETEQEQLIEATKAKYDGVKVPGSKALAWVVSEHDLVEAKEKALAAGKIPLFFDAPPGELDMPTTRYKGKVGARCQVVDMQRQCMRVAEHELTTDEGINELRDALLECMQDGQELLLRLGHTAPDFMCTWNRKDLPLEFLTPEGVTPGPLPKTLHSMLHKPDMPGKSAKEKAEAAKAQAEKFHISPGYALVITSCFNLNDYAGFLRAKLPLQYMQPIQVMPTLYEVADVLRDGLPKSTDDDVFAEMDRLADLL